MRYKYTNHLPSNASSGGTGGAKPSLSTTQRVKLNTRPLGQAILGGAFKDAFSVDSLDKASFRSVGETNVTDPVVAPPDAEGRCAGTGRDPRC
ncbi:hypothetical protein PG997_014115 [Apiospora hydei]|uniref:Uncharacterized protein n=1 Tax=Apiospora hydei TaxID=1337664 RepID=A0ABR1VBQ9_9PEZI